MGIGVGRTYGKLTARAVATVSKPGYHGDGGGLYLQVTPAGSRSWIFRFTLHGRAREMGLGSAQLVSLADARREAISCRVMLHQGIDPIEARRSERRQRRATAPTFAACAESYVASHRDGWHNAKHAAQWTSTLTTYAYPHLSGLTVDAIDTDHVLRVLQPIWTERTETANRVRGRVEAVLDWAAARGLRAGVNPARWRGHLDKLLPARSRVQRVTHHAALPYADMPAFMQSLREQPGLAARGLELQILTAARSGEVLGATWEEFQLKAKLWVVPATRMKARREHRFALSAPALSLLDRLRETATGEHVLPGRRQGAPLSNMAFAQLLRRMGREDITAHGFRSSFRDWVAEQTTYPRELAEMALAHVISDKVEAAYRRGDMLQRRHAMMEDWARFCQGTDAAPG